MANFQESCVFGRIVRSLFTKSFRPAIRNCSEVRISAAPDFCDQLRQRVGKVLIIADTEPIPLHDDVAAEKACVVIERGELAALGG